MEGDIRDVVFSLFAESERWSVKDIVRKSNRNEKEIREVRELCGRESKACERYVDRTSWAFDLQHYTYSHLFLPSGS